MCNGTQNHTTPGLEASCRHIISELRDALVAVDARLDAAALIETTPQLMALTRVGNKLWAKLTLWEGLSVQNFSSLCESPLFVGDDSCTGLLLHMRRIVGLLERHSSALLARLGCENKLPASLA